MWKFIVLCVLSTSSGLRTSSKDDVLDVGGPCSAEAPDKVRDDCLTRHIIHHAESDTVTTDYLYKGPGGLGDSESIRKHYSARLANCADSPVSRRSVQQSQEMLYTKKDKNQPCLWDTMSPQKILATSALAKHLRVNHIIEIRRSGGMAAFAYANQGFNVTTISYSSVGEVEADLKKLVPENLRTMDGNVTTEAETEFNAKLSQLRLSEAEFSYRLQKSLHQRMLDKINLAINTAGPREKFAVVIEGPTGHWKMNREIGLRLLQNRKIAFVSCDGFKWDQRETIARFTTADPEWRDYFPISKDNEVVKGVTEFPDDDIMTIYMDDKDMPLM